MVPTTLHSVTLRPAQANDEAFLQELYRSARAEEMAAWGWDESQQQLFLGLQFRAQQAHYNEYPNTDHKIISEGELEIGRILVSRLEDEIRLVDITLLAKHRGQGIGKMLIQSLIDEAAQRDKTVRLHVAKSNRAQQLYSRLGFQIIGDAQSHHFMEWKKS